MKLMRLLLVLILSALCFSCEKAKDSEVDPVVTPTPLKKNFIAGQFIGDSIVLKCFTPVLEVKGFRKGNDLDYTYLDSVIFDLNSDGIDDIKFRYYEHLITSDCPQPTDPNVVVDCFPIPTLSGDIKLLSNIEIAYSVITYPETVTQAQRFVQGDTISNHTLWTNNSIQMIGLMQSCAPFNCWSNNDYLSFVGLRMINGNDTIYSWIRVNTAYNSKFLISDYAVSLK